LKVKTPEDKPHCPAVLKDATALADPCPFFDPADEYCCADVNVVVMTANYQALDAVFTTDCPVCGVNLKRMWCEYGCNKNTTSFLTYNGKRDVGEQTMALINFNIDA